MKRAAYPTNLTDREWQILEPLVPSAKPGGRPAKYPRREIVNGIRYVLRTGCAWRLRPHDLPPWQLVYPYFRVWRQEGVRQAMHEALLPQARHALGRQSSPRAAILDSQSVKTTDKGGGRGYDAGQQVMGRKRHPAVDTQGLLLAVVVHPADPGTRTGRDGSWPGAGW